MQSKFSFQRIWSHQCKPNYTHQVFAGKIAGCPFEGDKDLEKSAAAFYVAINVFLMNGITSGDIDEKDELSEANNLLHAFGKVGDPPTKARARGHYTRPCDYGCMLC